MIDIVRDTIVVMLFATLIPVVAVIWKMAFMELFGNDRRKELDRFIERQIDDINKLAEDLK